MKKLIQTFVFLAVLGTLVAAMFPRSENTGYLQDLANSAVDAMVPPACADAVYARQKLLDGGGNMYCINNPTPGTGVSYALSGTYGSSTAMFTFFNAASSTKMFLPDHIKLIASGTQPTITSIHYLMEVDSTARAPTAGNATRTPTNVNGASTTTSSIAVQGFNSGAMAVPAATSTARTVARGSLEWGQSIAGDEYVIDFGDSGDGGGTGMTTAARAVTPGRFTTNGNPFILAPGQYGVFHLWLPSASGSTPAYEFEACWMEQ
jgi:hypothetical protein